MKDIVQCLPSHPSNVVTAHILYMAYHQVQPLLVVGNSKGCGSEGRPVKDGQILTKPVSLGEFPSNYPESRMKTEIHLAYILVLLAFLISSVPILRTIRFGFWQQKSLEEKKPRTPKPLKPKTPDDCAICREEKGSPAKEVHPCQLPRRWSEVRNRRGRQKSLSTQGYACINRKCAYFRVMDERVHALVGYGHHGKNERIQGWMCQACGRKFTVRRDTVLYRLKSHSEKVALSLALLAEGMDVSALERVTGIREGTLRTWLTQAGLHAENLHHRFF